MEMAAPSLFPNSVVNSKVGGLLVLGVGIVAGVLMVSGAALSVDLYHDLVLRPFRPYLSQYGKAAWAAVDPLSADFGYAPPHLRGKVVVIRGRSPVSEGAPPALQRTAAFDPSEWAFHDFYFDLPLGLRAHNPAEVGSILVLNCSNYRTQATTRYFQGGREVGSDAKTVERCAAYAVDFLSGKLTGKLYGYDGSRHGILDEIARLERR
jgi:hypothetical protein